MPRGIAHGPFQNWTPPEDETLRLGYANKVATLSLAWVLGKTKNAIVGRARRLGLSNPEANPVKRKAPEPLFQNPETTGCRFPMWGDEPPTQQFCGATRQAGAPYCAKHFALCNVKPSDRAVAVTWNYGPKPAEKVSA